MGNLSQFYMDMPANFRIRVYGHPSAEWVQAMCGEVTVTADQTAAGVETEVVGEMADQAALLGLVNALYNYGYAVILIERLESGDLPAVT